MKDRRRSQQAAHKRSSSPLRGVTTRSRSEIFLRSNHVYSPPAVISRQLLPVLKPNPSPPGQTISEPSNFPLDDAGVVLSGTIKDLRARRVFSPPSLGIEGFEDRMDGVEEEKCALQQKGDGGEIDQMDGAEDEKCELEKNVVGEKGDGGGADAETFQSSDVESTPPERSLQGFEAGGLDPAPGDDGVSQKDTVSSNLSRNRQDHVSGSRLKLFWNSSSHCYRRLLPFLKDLTKNSSSTLEILPCKNYPIKVEKALEERPLTQSVALPPQVDVDASFGQPKVEVVEEAEQFNEAQALPKNSEDSRSNEQDTSMIPLHSYSSAADHSSRNASCECNLLSKSECSPVSREALSFEELAGCMGSPADLYQFSRKTAEVQQLPASVSKVDAMPHSRKYPSGILGPTRCNALAPVKGILKRQRRGCRGLCTCLDCSSFLLHAERAFEFSKRQMQEAEDVTEGLIKELAYLRKVVVNSIVPVVGIQRHALQLNQVEEVCRRASRAEKLARNQLREMTTDLNIHCRTNYSPPPRVTFAESVEERIMPNLCTSASNNKSITLPRL